MLTTLLIVLVLFVMAIVAIAVLIGVHNMATLADISTKLTSQSAALDDLAVKVQALKDSAPSQQSIDAIDALVDGNQGKINAIASVATPAV